jgi:hypothetical protein
MNYDQMAIPSSPNINFNHVDAQPDALLDRAD